MYQLRPRDACDCFHHRACLGNCSCVALPPASLQSSVKPLLQNLGLPTEPPPLTPARGPPLEDTDIDQRPEVELGAPEPIPEYEFDQRVSW